MDCPARQLCDFFASAILLTTDFCGTIPRATIKTTNLMQGHGTICIVKVFLLSEREISQNYTGVFLDFVYGFGLYVKGLPKTKRYNSEAVTVSVRIRCICETALILKSSLILFIQETPKRVHLQTVMTQMKCSIMLHFIWVYTVCKGKKIFRQKKTIFFMKIIT